MTKLTSDQVDQHLKYCSMEDQVILYTPPKPRPEDFERADKELIKLVEQLESTAYQLMQLSSNPALFASRNGGRLQGYADILQDISTNICQTFNIYG